MRFVVSQRWDQSVPSVGDVGVMAAGVVDEVEIE